MSESDSTVNKGKRYEHKARVYLEQRGLKLIEHNYRGSGGEIDIVMTDGCWLVFVEVRFRRSDQFGSGAESIDHFKQARLIRCANHYLQKNAKTTQMTRFDVISIGQTNGTETIQWIKDAIQA